MAADPGSSVALQTAKADMRSEDAEMRLRGCERDELVLNMLALIGRARSRNG
jgi:hypothetical protein